MACDESEAEAPSAAEEAKRESTANSEDSKLIHRHKWQSTVMYMGV